MSLLTVPNFSEGRNERVVRALEATLGAHARLLNCHFDAEHNRCVFTLAADRRGAGGAPPWRAPSTRSS